MLWVHTVLYCTHALSWLCARLSECAYRWILDMEISFVLLCIMLEASVTPASAAAQATQVKPAFHFEWTKSIDHCWEKWCLFYLIKIFMIFFYVNRVTETYKHIKHKQCKINLKKKSQCRVSRQGYYNGLEEVWSTSAAVSLLCCPVYVKVFH